MRRTSTALLLASCVLFAACSPQGQSTPAATPKAATGNHLVEAALISQREISPTATRSGTLRARRTIQILPQEEGRILELPFFAGDRVEKGALLLRLDDTLLAAELRKAEAQRRQAEIDLQRVKRLAEQHLISEELLARAQTTLDVALAEETLLRTRLAYTRITAPFAGVISQRQAEPGDVVQRYTQVLTLTDPASLVTDVTVSELLLPVLAVGDPVQLVIDALGEASHAGRIQRIHPTVDAATRQGTVEVVLDHAPAGALPGQLCRVTLTGRAQSRRVIPFAALRRDNRGEFVFILDAQDKVQRSAVTSGVQLGEWIELINGPAAGQTVVVKGFLGLTEGATVKIAGKSGPAQ